MASHHDPKEDNFVMSEENAAQAQEDDREEYFETAAGRMGVRSHIPVILGAVGLILVVLIVWLFLSGGRPAGDGRKIEKFESRLTQLEEKLSKLEWLDQGLARLDKQEKDFAALNEKIEKMEAAYGRELAKLNKNVRNLDKKAAPASVTREAQTAPAEPKAAPVTPQFHVVKAGDTLYGISRKYGIDLGRLRQLNSLTPKSKIFPGQKLELAP